MTTQLLRLAWNAYITRVPSKDRAKIRNETAWFHCKQAGVKLTDEPIGKPEWQGLPPGSRGALPGVMQGAASCSRAAGQADRQRHLHFGKRRQGGLDRDFPLAEDQG